MTATAGISARWYPPYRPVAAAGLLGGLAVLILAPLAYLLVASVTMDAGQAWWDVTRGPASGALMWRPLGASLAIAVAVGVLATAAGGLLAGLVVLTDLPGRTPLHFLICVPFLVPTFAVAMAWRAAVGNGRIGEADSLAAALGLVTPDWLAWGPVPVVVVLVMHNTPIAYLLVAAFLSTLRVEAVEAAKLAGAGVRRQVVSILLPMIKPALLASGALCFAQAIGNFAAPAILGPPVRFHTLSTRLFGMIETGQTARGYALAILLTLVAALGVLIAFRLGLGRSGGAGMNRVAVHTPLYRLGRWRPPVAAGLHLGLVLLALVPVAVLVLSSLSATGDALARGWTLHFWAGAADPAVAEGQAGVLRTPAVYAALGVTLALGAGAAVLAAALALLTAMVARRIGGTALRAGLSTTLTLPLLVPSLALGAAFLALYGGPIGPLPALYGTFLLLLLIGVVALLPFAGQTAQVALARLPTALEDAARLAGANGWRRLTGIVLPLTARALIAGALLNFVRLVRNLDLVVLVFTPVMPLLAVLAYRYAAEGFAQLAHAVAVLIVALSLIAAVAARLVEGRLTPEPRS